MPNRLSGLYFLVVCATLTFVLYWRSSPAASTGILEFNSNSPANSTLGFGAIYAVSGPGSPRRDGLLQSANVTGLDIEVPDLPNWTQEQVDEFRDWDHLDKSTIIDGSIKAWLSHAVILKEFIKSGKETALFIEDDVDWDIRLRTVQIPAAAAAQRSLLPPSPKQHYWGNSRDWDLLYLGHCGDYFSGLDDMHVGVGVLHPSDLEAIPHALYKDDTLPEPSDIHPFTSAFLSAFNLPPKTRIVHKSKWPLCTFGYAVTRNTATRLLEDLAPAVEVVGKWVHAYDIAILEACRDKGIKCFTVNPELFHHMPGKSLIDGAPKDKYALPPADRIALAQVQYNKETSNIGCGFWSQDFRWNGDMERLTYLKNEVGRKGRCLKPGRADDGSRLKVSEAPVEKHF